MGINVKLVRATKVWATWTTRLFLLAVIVWLRRNTSVWVKASDTDYHGWRTGIWTPMNQGNTQGKTLICGNRCPKILARSIVISHMSWWARNTLDFSSIFWNCLSDETLLYKYVHVTHHAARRQLGISRKIVKISENSNKF